MNLDIKIKILESGRSQVALAKEIEIAESIFSKIVNGWIEPSDGLKKKIARVLDCRVEELFPIREERGTGSKG